MHIGGARTALFNYLFAKYHGGQYLLRIEDTDKQRSTTENSAQIISSLSWLGIKHDCEIITQSHNIGRHQQIVAELLASGHAYKCFLTQEQLATIRLEKNFDKSLLQKWRNVNDAEQPKNQDYSIRLKTPASGYTIINDMVQGEVKVNNAEIDDYVILRPDGSPTYMLSCVVDDHDMAITHVIRGDDHLNNAFRQQILFTALGWDTPQYAHIPLIHGTDGKKLSKRNNVVSLDEFKELGYLPEAINHYLATLGWYNEILEKDIINLENIVTVFDGSHLHKSAAKFDTNKLKDINASYIRKLNANDVDDLIFSNLNKGLSEKALPLIASLQQRAKTLCDIVAQSNFIDGIELSELSDETKARLDSCEQQYFDITSRWINQELLSSAKCDHGYLFSSFKDYCTKNNVKIGKVVLPLRVALTGNHNSISVFEVIPALGTTEVKHRWQKLLEFMEY
jgi:glutamyl-tRNA synthetase